MEALQWFCLGVLTMGAAMGLIYLNMISKQKWYTNALLIIGYLAVGFGIAWAGSSLVEGYPESSALGLTFFSGPGLLVLILTWIKLVAPAISVPSRDAA